MLDVIGLTNALTDIVIKVSDTEMEHLGIKKAMHNSLSRINQNEFYKMILKKDKDYIPSGSPANMIFNSNKLGLKTGLIGSVGKDELGIEYIKTICKEGIESYIKVCEGKSGVCYVLITPDGERTNIAKIGVANDLGFDLAKTKRAKILHTSGYELDVNVERTLEVIDYIIKDGAKLSFDLANDEMVRRHRKSIESIVNKTSVLFMTEEEAKELTGQNPLKALKEISMICEVVALKKGQKGSEVRRGREQHKIKTYSSKIKNTCGAGDAYASGFIHTYLKKGGLNDCGNMGSWVASKVCGSEKSHLYKSSKL